MVTGEIALYKLTYSIRRYSGRNLSYRAALAEWKVFRAGARFAGLVLMHSNEWISSSTKQLTRSEHVDENHEGIPQFRTEQILSAPANYASSIQPLT